MHLILVLLFGCVDLLKHQLDTYGHILRELQQGTIEHIQKAITDKVQQIHGVSVERSIGYVDDMDELRRELAENDSSLSMDHAVGWQDHSVESEGGEQRLTPGDGSGGVVSSQQVS